MLAMNTTEYVDVFQETIKYTGAMPGGGTWLALIFGALTIGMWFLSGMPGWGPVSDRISNKAHNIFCICGVTVVAVLAVIGAVMGIMNTVEASNEMNKLRSVQSSMEENVAKKYDVTLQVSLGEIPAAGERDKPNDYTLVFNDEDKEKRVIQRYEIRFDRATSEPFLSEVEAPTANELEVAAK